MSINSKYPKVIKNCLSNYATKFHISMRRLKHINLVQKHFGIMVNLACIRGLTKKERDFGHKSFITAFLG